MPVDVIMPQMGESIQEGTLVKWLKKPGDSIGRDEPLFEISTDKVDAEIPSPAAGVLKEIKVKEGETVAIKTVVAVIDTEGAGAKAGASAPAAADRPPEEAEGAGAKAGASAPAAAERPPEEATAAGDGPKPEGSQPPTRTEPSTPSRPTPAPAAVPSGGGGLRAAAPGTQTAARGGTATLLEERLRTKSSPVVRKIAAEHGVEIAGLQGTGISGRVTKKDILGYIETQEAAPAQPAAAGASPAAAMEAPRAVPAFSQGERFERVPMTTMRRKIAEHMILSRRTSAHVSTVFEVDMTRVAKIRAAKKDAFMERHGVNLTFMPFIMKATIDALMAYPTLNASIDGNDVLLKKDIHLGMAVALDWGLIVPVIKNAQDLSMAGLAKTVNDLANRARGKQLKPDEVAGGTFTITNPGVFGSLFGTPIINQPQVAILGVGTIEKRPVVIDDAIAIRTMAYLSISFDHRLIDGAVADQFMARIKKTLQEFDEAQV
jgi:pyruvate dehydrogenase E2 component (dihydrolipoamide acetyltransferase)